MSWPPLSTGHFSPPGTPLHLPEEVYYEHILPFASSVFVIPVSKFARTIHPRHLRSDINAILRWFALERSKRNADAKPSPLPLSTSPSPHDIEGWIPRTASNNKRLKLSEDSRVTEIAIRSTNLYLQENVLELLSPLDRLEVLSLFNNAMKFQIPANFNLTCTNLTKLWLNDNQISGEYPTFETTPLLVDLSLGQNLIRRPIPTDAWIKNLKHLAKLSVDMLFFRLSDGSYPDCIVRIDVIVGLGVSTSRWNSVRDFLEDEKRERMMRLEAIQVSPYYYDENFLGEGPKLWSEDGSVSYYDVKNKQAFPAREGEERSFGRSSFGDDFDDDFDDELDHEEEEDDSDDDFDHEFDHELDDEALYHELTSNVDHEASYHELISDGMNGFDEEWFSGSDY